MTSPGYCFTWQFLQLTIYRSGYFVTWLLCYLVTAGGDSHRSSCELIHIRQSVLTQRTNPLWALNQTWNRFWCLVTSGEEIHPRDMAFHWWSFHHYQYLRDSWWWWLWWWLLKHHLKKFKWEAASITSKKFFLQMVQYKNV